MNPSAAANQKQLTNMNEINPDKLKPTAQSETKPGFFRRIFSKLDQSMKEQAEKQAEDTCCSEDSKKGGKCC